MTWFRSEHHPRVVDLVVLGRAEALKRVRRDSRRHDNGFGARLFKERVETFGRRWKFCHGRLLTGQTGGPQSRGMDHGQGVTPKLAGENSSPKTCKSRICCGTKPKMCVAVLLE